MSKRYEKYNTWVPDFFINYATKNRKKFYSLEQVYDKARISRPFVLFLSSIIFYYIILTLFYLFFTLYVFSAGFTSFTFRDFLLAMFFFFVVSPLGFLALYHYPHFRAFLLKVSLDPEIKKVSKFFLKRLDEGARAYDIFEELANSKLKASSKEFNYIMHLVKHKNKVLIEAIGIAASETPSDRFREFLYDLNLTIRHEKELRIILEKYSK